MPLGEPSQYLSVSLIVVTWLRSNIISKKIALEQHFSPFTLYNYKPYIKLACHRFNINTWEVAPQSLASLAPWHYFYFIGCHCRLMVHMVVDTLMVVRRRKESAVNCSVLCTPSIISIACSPIVTPISLVQPADQPQQPQVGGLLVDWLHRGCCPQLGCLSLPLWLPQIPAGQKDRLETKGKTSWTHLW